jgi:hypothetical protein
MTHAALTDPTQFYVLVFLTLLLVMFLGAVIAAPPAFPGSAAPPVLEVHALPTVQAPAPPAPLPRRQPRATAPAAGAAGWPADGDAASHDAAPIPAHHSVRRPQVSGSPPWGPAPKPPGPDPWAAGNLSPGWRRLPDEGSVSPGAGRLTSSEPPPGTPAPAGNQARYPRHARGR